MPLACSGPDYETALEILFGQIARLVGQSSIRVLPAPRLYRLLDDLDRARGYIMREIGRRLKRAEERGVR